MLGTVGNRDRTVVGGVDKKNFEEEKLLKKIPGKIFGVEKFLPGKNFGVEKNLPGKNFGVEKFLPGKMFGVEKILPVFGITGTCAGVYSARVEGRHELV